MPIKYDSSLCQRRPSKVSYPTNNHQNLKWGVKSTKTETKQRTSLMILGDHCQHGDRFVKVRKQEHFVLERSMILNLDPKI